ncbi:MAG: ATP-binding protein [Paracoccaceae bacterium]|jgi:signal transduction histidine kinase|nr:ATP-binding protein [Paracoccaceae bacterium]
MRNWAQLEARLAEVEDRLSASEELFAIINRFAVDVMNFQTSSELMWHVAREVVGNMGFHDCVIYLTDPLGHYLRQVAAIGAKNPEGDDILNSLRIRVGDGVTGKVAQTGRAIIIDDLSLEPSYIPDLEPALSEICVPMMIDEKVVGVIDSEEARAGVFTARHLDVLSTIAAMASGKLKLIREAEQAQLRNRELERTRGRLERARQQAESANRVKNAFLGTLSHELRTPMNGVIGMGELLLHTDLNEKQENFVTVLLASAKSLTGLVDDLLDISMIEAGEMRLSLGSLNLVSMAGSMVSAFEATEIAQRVTLNLDYDAGLDGNWFGDGKRIRQVLSNLVNNAVKFTGEGEVTVSMRDQGAKVRFEVRDNGPGIPEDKLQAIFDRFQQVEEHESRRHGGVGIGLNICRQLVTAMRGSIGVESELGNGATFWFEIPLTREAVAETA